ncbi:MAG: hypothetical protein ABSG33_09085 [Candidatus Bathyarchaeia archaeon]
MREVPSRVNYRISLTDATFLVDAMHAGIVEYGPHISRNLTKAELRA